MSGFLGVPVGAAYHLVFALTQLLTAVAGGLAAAAAIVLFTAAVRLADLPAVVPRTARPGRHGPARAPGPGAAHPLPA